MPRMYPTYDEYLGMGQKIPGGAVIRDGVNSVGDPQLYRVMYDIAPDANMRPADIATAFLPVGMGKSGYPIWVQPLWYLDAYALNDKVDVDGTIYNSTQDGNMDDPTAKGAAWEPWKPAEDPPVEYNSNGTIKWGEWVDPKGIMTSYYNAGDGVTEVSCLENDL
jgi:hypothetical protein